MSDKLVKVNMLRDEVVSRPDLGKRFSPVWLRIADNPHELPEELANSLIGRGLAIAVDAEGKAPKPADDKGYAKMSVNDLKAELKALDLPVSGNKAALIKRLENS